MNRSDLIRLFQEKTGLDNSDSDWFVRQFFQVLSEGLARDGRVELRGFGVFRIKERDQAGFLNPKDGCYYGGLPIKTIRFQASLRPEKDGL